MVSFLQGLGAVGGGLLSGYEAGASMADRRRRRQIEEAAYADKTAGESALMKALTSPAGGALPQPQMAPGQPSQPMQQPVAPQIAGLQSAIYGQESGYGRNPATSPKGAMGGMQIMPATFQQFARPGESITDPAANKAVGDRILASYMQKYGDPARAAVAYFSGPGNVAPPGSPTPWKRDASDGRVSTSQYVQQVLGRMGGGQGAPSQQIAMGGGGDWRQFAQRIIQANPNLSPGGLLHALQAAQPFMNMESRQQLQEMGLGLREKALESRERMFGAGLQEKGAEAELRAETQTHIAQMRIDQAREALREKHDMFSTREQRLQKAHDDLMEQRKSATGEKAREFDIRLDMLKEQRKMLHEEKKDAIDAAQKRLETAEKGRAERLETVESGKEARLATTEGGKFARQEETERGRAERLDTSERGRLARQQIAEEERGVRQERGLGAAAERQRTGLEAASARQERGLSAAEGRQERGLGAAAERQRVGIEAATARQERGLSAQMERFRAQQEGINSRFQQRFQQSAEKLAYAKTKDEKARLLQDIRQAEQDRRAAAANAIKAAAAGMDVKELKKLEEDEKRAKADADRRIDELTRQARGDAAVPAARPSLDEIWGK